MNAPEYRTSDTQGEAYLVAEGFPWSRQIPFT